MENHRGQVVSPEVRERFINNSTNFMSSLFLPDGRHVIETVNHYVIVGTNRSTISGTIFSPDGRYINHLIFTCGDQTVPLWSATINNRIHRNFLTSFNYGHTEMMYRSRVIRHVIDVLNNARVDNPGDISNNRGRVVISVASPVDVVIEHNGEMLSSAYNSLMSRTSFGSLYFVGYSGTTVIFALNKDEIYNVLIKGTGYGTMNYSIKFYDASDNFIEERFFDDVPISPNTVISTDTDIDTVTNLFIDTNGDGSYDIILYPDIYPLQDNNGSDNNDEDRVTLPVQTPLPTVRPTQPPNTATPPPPSNIHGSTQGNFATGNPVGFSANHIYFSNTADFRLWRMDFDGGRRQQVGDFSFPLDIQYDNGWLFFIYDGGQAIIRLNTNNHNDYRELIDINHMGQIHGMQVINGFVYFYAEDVEGLHRMPLNGGTPETIINIALDGFTVTMDEIFIRYNNNLYRHNLNGTRLNLVVRNFTSNFAGSRVSVYDGWVYYVTNSIRTGGGHAYIIRVRPDGTGRETVVYTRINNWSRNMSVGASPVNVTDGWIYFWEIYDMAPAPWRNDDMLIARWVLCRVRIDGTGFHEIIRCNQLNPNSTFRSNFAVHDEFVYVIANNHNYRVGTSELYRVPVNGGRVELLQARTQ